MESTNFHRVGDNGTLPPGTPDATGGIIRSVMANSHRDPEATDPSPAVGRDGSRFIAVLVFAFALSQFVIPLTQSRSPRMTRFSWQMFSRKNSVMDFRVVDENGGTHDISAKAHLGVLRGDMDTEKLFPPYACRRFPRAVSVGWTGADGEAGLYRCP